jgi:membrane associated rhomboid family serine protease
MLDFIQASPVASAIFIFTIFTTLYTLYVDRQVLGQLMLHPYSFARGKNRFTIITSGLIHADLNHLFFNMLSYFFFAFTLERIVGHWQFLLIYILGLTLSDISTIIKNKNNSQYYSLGASGAVSAVLFSYILFDPLTKLYFFFIPVGIPAFVFAGLYLVYCVYAAKKQYGNINHEAHLWGAVTGWVVTIILYPQVVMYFINQLKGSL